METTILVAGATGNLGERIVKALIGRGATVKALVRKNTDTSKIDKLTGLGAEVIPADLNNMDELTAACQGVACVVSAVAGLRDVIVDTQSVLLKAAVAAGVLRFIPSDFSSDFTRLPEGENRNFDLRREFHKHLHEADISSTSIFNGAFANILGYNIPVYNLKTSSVGYWGDDPDYKLDFTTMDNTAQFTAAAALDASAPKALRIASFQVSPNELAAKGSELKGTPFKLIPMGSLADLAAYNKRERAANPAGENELYARWQQSQYMHSMFSVQNDQLDNNCYPGIEWTSAMDVISKF